MQKLNYCIALGGVLSSLSIFAMFLTGVFPVFYLVIPMICSLLVTIMMKETGLYWGFIMYLAISILSLFITPNKDAPLIYLFFFGHYPLIRHFISKLHIKPLKGIIKLIIFNACILLYFAFTVYLLGMGELLEEMEEFGKYAAYILLGSANIMFISYDICLSSGLIIYEKKLRPKIFPSK